MKRRITAILLALALMLVPCIGAMAKEQVPESVNAIGKEYDITTSDLKNKVILDCDLTPGGIDALAILLAAQADAAGWIDLLGVTSSGTDAHASCEAILQLLGALGYEDVAVYEGADRPILNKPETNDSDEDQDAYGYAIEALLAQGEDHSLEAQKDAAAVFMTQTVEKNPGKVTILELGSCTNVALACRLDGSFAGNTAGIFYAAGNAGFNGGDRNFGMDPEAAYICLHSAFPEQTILSSETAAASPLCVEDIDLLMDKNKSDTAAYLVACLQLMKGFQGNENTDVNKSADNESVTDLSAKESGQVKRMDDRKTDGDNWWSWFGLSEDEMEDLFGNLMVPGENNDADSENDQNSGFDWGEILGGTAGNSESEQTRTPLSCVDDLIVMAQYLVPGLVTDSMEMDVAVDLSSEYRRGGIAYWKEGKGSNESIGLRVITEVDKDRMWSFATDVFGAELVTPQSPGTQGNQTKQTQ